MQLSYFQYLCQTRRSKNCTQRAAGALHTVRLTRFNAVHTIGVITGFLKRTAK